MKRSSTLLIFLSAIASSTATAQADSNRSPDLVITPHPATSQYLSGVELRPQEKNGVAYLCGGVGSEEQAQMKSAASKYDVMMTFAAANGAYIADVNVDIADNKGQSVFSASCDAPIMLVDLPRSGNYKISAEAAGKKLTRSTRVSEKGSVKRVAMTWPTDVVDMGLAPGTAAGGSQSSGRSSGSSGMGSASDGGPGAEGATGSGIR